MEARGKRRCRWTDGGPMGTDGGNSPGHGAGTVRGWGAAGTLTAGACPGYEARRRSETRALGRRARHGARRVRR
eukprot:879023-Prymnesium_polylepis.1